ncbi:MAG: DNA-protecting protein DprA [Deltaproteobacteria bacterium]|nr:DNA-protecting protein DprA [Deltaproteobacteria bacterium]
MKIQQQKDWLRLHLTQGVGRVGIIKLIEAFGDANTALDKSRQDWQRYAGLKSLRIGSPPAEESTQFNAAWDTLTAHQGQIISLWDDHYPSQLRTIHDPPALLYVCGAIPNNMCIAIVGSRKASAEGKRLANEAATTLSNYGVTVVSGLARGIDTAAHSGAVTGQGSTIAVLGGGIDIIYPPENHALFKQIKHHGAIISEYPPGTEPLPGHFPARNRIISGLSHGVFLKQGAILITEAEDILTFCHIDTYPQHIKQPPKYDQTKLSAEQNKVFDLLHATPLHLDQLAQESGLTAMEVSAIVLHLELEGLASSQPGGRYIRGSAA